MASKNTAAVRSAAEAHEVGCPLPAAVVARTLSIRSWVATSSSARRRASVGMLTAMRRSGLQCKRHPLAGTWAASSMRDMEPLERRYYGNERYRARERERRTRHPGGDLGYQIGPA